MRVKSGSTYLLASQSAAGRIDPLDRDSRLSARSRVGIGRPPVIAVVPLGAGGGGRRAQGTVDGDYGQLVFRGWLKSGPQVW